MWREYLKEASRCMIQGPQECTSRAVTWMDNLAHGSSQSIHVGVRLWQEGAQTLSKGDQVIG